MNSFWTWLASQSGISLLVAIIALVGVLIATGWNNCAADKRRIHDQSAADERRKEDQAAEDTRRKADDDRRERERLEQLQREDWTRQRRAVADCIRAITKAATIVSERATTAAMQEGGDAEYGKIVKAIELTHFNVEATSQLTLLDIEITQPHVKAKLEALWNQIKSDYQPLQDARIRGGQAWIDQAEEMQPLSDRTLLGIRALTVTARLALLEHPEHMATQPVADVDLEALHQFLEDQDEE